MSTVIKIIKLLKSKQLPPKIKQSKKSSQKTRTSLPREKWAKNMLKHSINGKKMFITSQISISCSKKYKLALAGVAPVSCAGGQLVLGILYVPGSEGLSPSFVVPNVDSAFWLGEGLIQNMVLLEVSWFLSPSIPLLFGVSIFIIMMA